MLTSCYSLGQLPPLLWASMPLSVRSGQQPSYPLIGLLWRVEEMPWLQSLAVSLAQGKWSTIVSAPSIWKLTNSINQNRPPPLLPKPPCSQTHKSCVGTDLHKSSSAAPSYCNPRCIWLSVVPSSAGSACLTVSSRIPTSAAKKKGE